MCKYFYKLNSACDIREPERDSNSFKHIQLHPYIPIIKIETDTLMIRAKVNKNKSLSHTDSPTNIYICIPLVIVHTIFFLSTTERHSLFYMQRQQWAMLHCAHANYYSIHDRHKGTVRFFVTLFLLCIKIYIKIKDTYVCICKYMVGRRERYVFKKLLKWQQQQYGNYL